MNENEHIVFLIRFLEAFGMDVPEPEPQMSGEDYLDELRRDCASAIRAYTTNQFPL